MLKGTQLSIKMAKKDVISFGMWLQQRRKALDLTQAALADLVHCTPTYLRKIEAEERKPSAEMALLLAQSLGVEQTDHEAFVAFARGSMLAFSQQATLKLNTSPWKPDSSPNSDTIGQPFVGADKHIPQPQHNLPIKSTSLVGRNHEIAYIEQQFLNKQVRWVTLLGEGGIGKTRVALAMAQRMVHKTPERFYDGVFWVSLDTHNNPSAPNPALPNAINNTTDVEKSLANRIARALNLHITENTPITAALHAHLHNKKILMVLDQFEGRVAAREFVWQMLEQAPELAILVTSREKLNMSAEHVVRLHELSSNDSEMLFIDRAQQTNADFEPDVPTQSSLKNICALLHGLPLAIELAAAWTHVMTCEEIADEIKRDLSFLSTPLHDVPASQRSMQAVFEHSWKLLAPDEQQLLAQLTIFRGGFTRAAAIQVCNCNALQLAALVDKSLVAVSRLGQYAMHPLIAHFASDKLTQWQAVATQGAHKHWQYYAEWLYHLSPGLNDERQQRTLRQIIDEFDNIRKAWHYAIAHNYSTSYYKMGWALSRVCDMQGWYEAYAPLFRQAALSIVAVEITTAEQALILGCVLTYLAMCESNMPNGSNDAVNTMTRVLSLLRSTQSLDNAKPHLAYALWLFAAIARRMGIFEQAIEWSQAALDLYTQLDKLTGDLERSWGICVSQLALGESLVDAKQEAAAKPHFEQALAIAQRLNLPRAIGLCWYGLACVWHAAGDLDGTKMALQQALDTYPAEANQVGRAKIQQLLKTVAASYPLNSIG